MGTSEEGDGLVCGTPGEGDGSVCVTPGTGIMVAMGSLNLSDEEWYHSRIFVRMAQLFGYLVHLFAYFSLVQYLDLYEHTVLY